MPAKSKKQQRLFGMVHAYQKGELKNPSQEVKDIAGSISKKAAKDFAETKQKGLPNKVKQKKNESREPLKESFGIYYNGRFITTKGWGPTFTSFPEDAMKFNTPQEAERYMKKNLSDFDASVVSLPLALDESKRNIVRISEQRLHSIISESITKVLKEYNEDNFISHGYKTDSNWGGKEIQINNRGDAARFRDNHGTPGEPSEWMEIQFDEEGIPYVDTGNGIEKLSDYMRY